MSLFFKTCQKIAANPGVNTLVGLARHSVWHGVRRFAPLPLTVELSEQSKLVLTQRGELNGTVALTWSQRLYDYNNMSFIREITQHPDVVKTCDDVGANLGTYALLMSERPHTQVACFEPHPQTFRSLTRILAANGRNQVRAINQPLSDRAMTLSFSDEDFTTINRVVTDTAGPVIQVEATTGALHCETRGCAPDLLKIDTEGHEPEVLRGYGTWLHQVKIVLVEENTEAATLTEFLPPSNFIGPLYLDYQARTFTQERHWPEDAFYLNRAVLPQLTQLGFQLPSSAS